MDHSRTSKDEKAKTSRGGGEEEEIETLKNRIRSHDLFKLLLEKHTECLKVFILLFQSFDSLLTICDFILIMSLNLYYRLGNDT